MFALDDDVADVAKGEQVTDNGSGKARQVVGVSGQQTGREPAGDMRRRSLFRRGLFKSREEVDRHRQILRLREIDKTLSKVRIAVLQCGFDFPVYQLRIGSGRFADLQLAEQGRIVLRGQQCCCITRIRPHIGERHREGRKTCEASGQSKQQLHVSLFPLVESGTGRNSATLK
jgi:hypothetical protein